MRTKYYYMAAQQRGLWESEGLGGHWLRQAAGQQRDRDEDRKGGGGKDAEQRVETPAVVHHRDQRQRRRQYTEADDVADCVDAGAGLALAMRPIM